MSKPTDPPAILTNCPACRDADCSDELHLFARRMWSAVLDIAGHSDVTPRQAAVIRQAFPVPVVEPSVYTANWNVEGQWSLNNPQLHRRPTLTSTPENPWPWDSVTIIEGDEPSSPASGSPS